MAMINSSQKIVIIVVIIINQINCNPVFKLINIKIIDLTSNAV